MKIEKSHKGLEYINVELKEDWLGRKAGSRLPIIRLQAEKMINRGVAIAVDDIKPKAKRGKSPANRAAAAPINK